MTNNAPSRYRRLPLPPAVRRLLSSASRWVPRSRRANWRREWEAELVYAWSQAAAGQGASPRRLLMRALWSHLDALWIWKEELTVNRLLADIRLALRSLRRSPMFTAVSVITLALGIGASTAIFSVVNGVLIKPLPYPEPDRLLVVLFEAPGIGYPEIPFSEGVYLFVRDNQRSFEAIGMFNEEKINLVGDGDPEQVAGARITPSLLDVLRVTPSIGRLFVQGDAESGAAPVSLLSHALWSRRYGADPSVVGTMVELDGVMRRIVGVLPESFRFPDNETRVWRPFVIDPANAPVGNFSYLGIGRLADGATHQSAHDDMASLVARFGEEFPDDLPTSLLEQARFAPNLSSLRSMIVGDIQQALWIVLGAVAVVLLTACANVANLFLVRAETRQREVTLRAALGAGRADVARFYLTESILLGLGGGIAGLVLAWVALRAFVSSAPVAIPRIEEIGIDGTVLALTFVISVLTGVLFGAVPMVRRGARSLATQLREGGRSTTTARRALNTRGLLVIAQVALALVLLVGSGLMIRSFRALRHVDPGFRADSVLTVGVAPPGAEYPGPDELTALWTQLLPRLETVPGVIFAGAINGIPLGGGQSAGAVEIEDHPTEDDALPHMASKRSVMPGYFETMGISILEGRKLEATDAADNFRGLVVSRSFARHWWPNESALGKRVREDEESDWYEIVGMVGDVHFKALEVAAEEVLYWPLRRDDGTDIVVPGAMDLVIRTTGDPTAITEAVRRAVWDVAPRLPIANMRPMSGVLENSVSRTSFTLAILGIASAVTLLLGAVGIYGVISYLVSQRTLEIGVRLALGAPASTVRRMVVQRGMVLTAIGIGVGLAAALAVSSVLAALLYEVSATDPLTFVGMTVVLALTALIASWLPALRASSVDPIVALRAE